MVQFDTETAEYTHLVYYRLRDALAEFGGYHAALFLFISLLLSRCCNQPPLMKDSDSSQIKANAEIIGLKQAIKEMNSLH